MKFIAKSEMGGEGVSDYITTENLQLVIETNKRIKNEIEKELLYLFKQFNIQKGIKSEEKLAFDILKQYGLIQLPIDNKYWSGAIFCRNEKKIPIINTALPRMNQFYTAWHEVYHLIYGKGSEHEVYEISTELSLDERRADYFAAKALMGNVYNYYMELKGEDFLENIAYCMDLYQVPFKAILIQLYEDAQQYKNSDLADKIIEYMDIQNIDWVSIFDRLGLDKQLVTASYVVNFGLLEDNIRDKMLTEPEVSAHEMNMKFLADLKAEIKKINKNG